MIQLAILILLIVSVIYDYNNKKNYNNHGLGAERISIRTISLILLFVVLMFK